MQTYDISGERLLLTPDNLKPFIEQIDSKHDTIDTVVLKTKTFSIETAKLICNELSKMNHLKYVDLSDTISGLEYTTAQKVLEVFIDCLKNFELVSLNLSDNAIGPEGISVLKPIVVGNNSLETLILMNVGLSSDSCGVLSSIFKEAAPTSLKKIHFDNNMSGDTGAEAIGALLSFTPLLEDFRWSTTRTHEDGGKAITEALYNVPCLKRLHISDNYFGEETGEIFYNAIKEMKQLNYLVLSDISLENEGVEYVLRGLMESEAPIEYLDISYNDLDVDILDILIEFLSKANHLKTLLLNDNQFASSGIISIAKALKNSCPHLEILNIDNNEIGSKAACFITSICANKSSFKTLSINGNCILADSILSMNDIINEHNKPNMIGSLEDNFEDDIEDSDEIEELIRD